MLAAHKIATAVVLALLTAWLLFGSWQASQGPYPLMQNRGTATEQRGIDHQSKEEREKTDEALARYTWWLMSFTGVLAFATIGLGIATLGLYLTGEKQIRVAREHADRQFVAIQNQIDLARDEFFSTHRPRVRIKHVFFTDNVRPDTPLTARVVCVNSGTIEATITEFGAKFLVVDGEGPLPFPNPPIPNVISGARYQLASGITLHLPNILNAIVLSAIQHSRILGGTNKLYGIGYLRYLDGAGRLRSTGFCRVLMLPRAEDNGRFRVFDDPDYEYED